MMQWMIQQITRPWRAVLRWYLRKPRSYRFDDMHIVVLPGVFHPGFFFSTKFILQFLRDQDLRAKQFLELGCGTGIIALAAARKGAIVTASDINTIAIRNAGMNAATHHASVNVIHSDLFTSIPVEPFDWIVVNPPYYPADPEDEPAHAWYCGKDHEYFTRLFADLGQYLHAHSHVLMVLSDVCNLSAIFSIAKSAGYYFEQIDQRSIWTDGKNYLFWVKSFLPRTAA
jgi:release factor glutamine methyltransferase